MEYGVTLNSTVDGAQEHYDDNGVYSGDTILLRACA